MNTSGIVSGSGSGSGSGSEIEGVGARESGCVEKKLVVEIEMRVEEWNSWKNERYSSAPAVNVNVHESWRLMEDLLQETKRSCPQALMDYSPSCYTGKETINVNLYSKGEACNQSDHPKLLDYGNILMMIWGN